MSGALSKAAARELLVSAGITPRGIKLEEAAAYVGLSPSAFEDAVKAGRFPQPLRFGGSDRKAARKVWDKAALDDAMDVLSGRVAKRTPSAGEVRSAMMEAIEQDA